MTSPRLDEWLVENGHYGSRARARDAINRGCVSVGDEVSAKPSRKVTDPKLVKISDPAQAYVSRAALKLEAALQATSLSPKDKICVDLGSSTGGFCEVLLRNDAAHVYGIDVGHDQMAESLLSNPSLTNLEGLNARDLTSDHLDGKSPEFITSDVSFISLKLVLPPVLALAAPGAIGIFLVKPQFEAGRDNIGKGGIVRDPNIAYKAASDVKDWLDGHPDWSADAFMPCPIKGGDGNVEYLLTGLKND